MRISLSPAPHEKVVWTAGNRTGETRKLKHITVAPGEPFMADCVIVKDEKKTGPAARVSVPVAHTDNEGNTSRKDADAPE